MNINYKMTFKLSTRKEGHVLDVHFLKDWVLRVAGWDFYSADILQSSCNEIFGLHAKYVTGFNDFSKVSVIIKKTSLLFSVGPYLKKTTIPVDPYELKNIMIDIQKIAISTSLEKVGYLCIKSG